MVNKLLNNLKHYSQHLKQKVLDKQGHIKKGTMHSVKTFLTVAIMFTFVLKVPELHKLYLRTKVGSKTYVLTNTKNMGGGTGFAVEAPSGKTYILTNSHVCEALIQRSDGKEVVSVVQDNGKRLERRIIAISDYTDLCLVEGLPGVSGLSVGDMPTSGQKMNAIGHPGLKPTTINVGEVNGLQDVDILVGPISGDMKVNGEIVKSKIFSKEEGGVLEADCHKPKNAISTITQDIMPGLQIDFKVCLNVTKSTYVTNIMSQPGSSGSPVTDAWGNVIGVLFAGDSFGWAYVVNANDIKQFLEMY